ncbi:LytR/AlgR family response regulator transcription factor [Pseudoalteromonas sp. S16_S37]|uniref:LytR/AlgR family response regulator transcription factor n=1 Tax=Pseudoalteromonas sp. S16_S37 TaxID=2720228 RepID=UPI0016817AC6|nr:LytTR family DNA-binding domain-containing protein [Pseudoalteromonas sp. S16_S37]MBD1583270.1 LytTR family transcriptional regulator [Pseudoalteromonas sp. S16_S37]
MQEFKAHISTPDQRTKYQWLLCALVWTLVILVLSAIEGLHDLLVAADKKYNNPWWWALQEWFIWYLFSPITFMLLDKLQHLNLLNKKGYLLTLLPMFCTTMTYQAIFDVFVYRDHIPSTMVYFAPSHFLILLISTVIWHKLWKTPQLDHQSTMLLVDQGRHKTLLALDDIVNINGASNYVEIHTQQDTYIKRATLTHIEQSLPASLFLRCHRSHLVNLRCIAHIERKPSGSAVIHLSNGQSVPLSKRYYSQVKSLSAA